MSGLWDIDNVYQEHKSNLTSINSQKLPGSIKTINDRLIKGQVWADIGGGRYDNVVEHFKSLGVDLHIYDPFNRSYEHNVSVVAKISHGQCDGVMVNNVLNVIKEPENRLKVIKQAYDVLKDKTSAYFLIYEGDKTSNEKVSKKALSSSSYQLNRPTQSYLSEIKSVFGDSLKIKGNLITAVKTLSLDDINTTDLTINKISAQLRDLGIVRNKSVGKLIGGNLYAHKSYASIYPESLQQALIILRVNHPDFNYEIIKHNQKENSYSFIQSKGFNTDMEPGIQDVINISLNNNTVKIIKGRTDPQIYHHKWQFVADDYKGFDVKTSMLRSLAWKTKLGFNKAVSSKIGTKSYWDNWLNSVDLPLDTNTSSNSKTKKINKQTSGLKMEKVENVIIKKFSELQNNSRWDPDFYIALSKLPAESVIKKLKKTITHDAAVKYINDTPTQYKKEIIANILKGIETTKTKDRAISEMTYEILALILSKHGGQIAQDLDQDKKNIDAQIKTTKKLNQKIK